MLNFFKNTLYIRLSAEHLSVLQVESDVTFSDRPWLAIAESKGKRTIIDYGESALTTANMPNVKAVNGFKHPRTIIADFTIAERTMTLFVYMACQYRNKFIRPSPIIVIHIIDEWEGGLTLVEIRALKKLCLRAGARAVYCWQGLELSHEELKVLAFPANKGKLLG